MVHFNMLTGNCMITRLLPRQNRDDKQTMDGINACEIVPPTHSYEEVDEEDKAMIIEIEALRQRVLSSSKYNKVSLQMLENKLDDLQRTVAMLGEAHCGQDGKKSLSKVHRERLDHWKQVVLANMTIGGDMYEALLANQVINQDQADEIKSLGTRRRQCESLLDLLVLTGDIAYGGFLCALSKTNQEFLVDILTSEIDVKTPYYCDDSTWESCYLGKPDIATLPISCFPKSHNTILLDIFSKAGDKFVFVNGVPNKTMSEVYQKALIKNHVRLSRELFAEILFDSLIEDEILTSDVTEGIFLVGSRHRMNQVLLHILPLLGDEAFVSFASALRKTGQDHLARLLDESVV